MKEGSCKIILKTIKSLISFIFHMDTSSTMIPMNTTSILELIQEEPSQDFTSLTKDLFSSIPEEDHITRTILYVAKGNIASKQFQKIARSRFSIWIVLQEWRRITPLSFLLEEYPLGRNHLNHCGSSLLNKRNSITRHFQHHKIFVEEPRRTQHNVLINEKLPIYLASSVTSFIQLF